MSRSPVAFHRQACRRPRLTQNLANPPLHGLEALSASHLILPCCNYLSKASYPLMQSFHPYGSLASTACIVHCTVSVGSIQLINFPLNGSVFPHPTYCSSARPCKLTGMPPLDNRLAWKLMRRLARPRISNQSSGLRKDARTGQSMPHRRSSDVAAAVWLISEESTFPGSPLASIMALPDPPRCLAGSSAVVRAGYACPQLAGRTSQDGKIRRSSTYSHRLPHCGRVLLCRKTQA